MKDINYEIPSALKFEPSLTSCTLTLSTTKPSGNLITQYKHCAVLNFQAYILLYTYDFTGNSKEPWPWA